MCCLQYEQNAYDDMLKKLPSKGALVETADGQGIVVDIATLKGQIKVKYQEGDISRIETYQLGEFKVIRGKNSDSQKPRKDKREKDSKAQPADTQANEADA